MIADAYTIYYFSDFKFLQGRPIDKGWANGTYQQVFEAAAWTCQQRDLPYFRLYHHATSMLYRPVHRSEALAFVSHEEYVRRTKTKETSTWTGD